MPHKTTANAEPYESSADNTTRPKPSGYLRVGQWMFMALFVLGFIFLLQTQFLDRSPPITIKGAAPADSANMGSEDSFHSYEEFIAQQEQNGFLFLGRFADQWPATIIEEKMAQNEISFDLNGRKHRYPSYDGYRLKVVRLRTHRDTEAVVVLRSREME